MAGRPARPWFRFYVEAFADRKLLRLTPAQRWLWVAVLGAARESPEPGRLMIAEGEAMTAAELARYADVPAEDVWPALEAMRRYAMVEWDDDGLISVCNWNHRQFESDDTTKRTAKHRSQERSNDVPGNTPETETETETEQVPAADAAVPYEADFEEWYDGYPRKRERGAARKAYTARRRAGAPHADLIAARDHYAASVIGTELEHVKYPASFLSGADGPWSEWVNGPPEPRLAVPKLNGNLSLRDPARAVLGRGLDAAPIFDLDDQGNARRASA